MQDQPSRAVLYAAKSTLDERGSIPAQLADGRAMAEREAWEIVGEYSDEAASAWSGDRGPELAAAMTHAERARAALVVQHSDRLARGDGRNARHLVEIALWALKTGVTISSVQDPSTFENLVMAVVMGERNTEDSRRKSNAVKAGMARRRERGLANGGLPPFGYRWDNGLVIVPPEAEIVRRIFAEYAAGRSQLAITRGLIRDDIPTARGGKWHQGTVRAILANPTYMGMIVDRGTGKLFEGVHAPIIDQEAWAKVETLRQARTRTAGGRSPAGKHLFRKGMLRCGECGEAMVPRTARNRGGTTYEVYHCYGRHRDSASCSMPTQERKQVDSAVFNYFSQVGLDVQATRSQLATARDRKLAEVRALREQAEREAKLATEALARVRRDYQRGAIEADDWAEQRPQLAEEREGARAQAQRLRDREAEVQDWGELEDAEAETLRRLSAIRAAIAGEVNDAHGLDAVRAALLRLFEGFIVRRSVPERAHVELIGETWIEPVIGEGAVVRYGEALLPTPRREPLEQAENNEYIGFTT